MFWIIAGGDFQGRAISAIRQDIVPLTVLLDGKLEKYDKVGKESATTTSGCGKGVCWRKLLFAV
jgi:hypothetical protein